MCQPFTKRLPTSLHYLPTITSARLSNDSSARSTTSAPCLWTHQDPGRAPGHRQPLLVEDLRAQAWVFCQGSAWHQGNTYVSMYVCMPVCVCVRVCVYVCMCIYIYIDMYVYMYMYICRYICMYNISIYYIEYIYIYISLYIYSIIYNSILQYTYI